MPWNLSNPVTWYAAFSQDGKVALSDPALGFDILRKGSLADTPNLSICD
jgi:hypothetical protein